MNRLLIVDGHNLLFQMFFGMPSRIVNKNGKCIQGVLGFVGALLKIIRNTKPTHIIVLFDGEHENGRSSLEPDYKANRIDYGKVSEKDTPFSQLPDICFALNFLCINYAETVVCEADDMIAGYAYKYGDDMEIVIVSLDSDFYQLITDNITVLRYRAGNMVFCTPDYIKEKFGINPSQYADFKSLTGDASDNIKGAERVGPKTAALLLKEFGTLENIITNSEKIKKPSIKNSITESSEKLKTNYLLIKLHDFSPLPFSLDKLKYNCADITTNEVLREIGLK